MNLLRVKNFPKHFRWAKQITGRHVVGAMTLPKPSAKQACGFVGLSLPLYLYVRKGGEREIQWKDKSEIEKTERERERERERSQESFNGKVHATKSENDKLKKNIQNKIASSVRLGTRDSAPPPPHMSCSLPPRGSPSVGD